MRHLATLHVCPLSDADMRTVFGHTLSWYHDLEAFPQPVIDLEPKIVDASLAVYDRVRTRLKPIPGYPQYVFSLRDLRRVLEGMCLQTAEDLADSIDSAENEHTRLWIHEVLRVFYDRVQDTNDR
jgi:dynein heavy chain